VNPASRSAIYEEANLYGGETMATHHEPQTGPATHVPSVAGTGAASFWTSISLDELARQQVVAPVSNLDEISDLWPADDDPDDLMRFVLSERHARRVAALGEHGR
jgi:hypothetical protein